MESRLKFCSVYLKEIECKLIRLLDSVDKDSEAKSTIVEALGFIQQAHSAVLQTQQRVGELQRADNQVAKRRSA